MPIPAGSTSGIIAVADLASYLREPAVLTDDDAHFYIDLANGIVGEIVGALDPIPMRARAITLEVAARAWRNPNGYSSETIDDYTYRRDADTRAAGVYLTDAERAELLGFLGTPRRSAYTVGLRSPLDAL